LLRILVVSDMNGCIIWCNRCLVSLFKWLPCTSLEASFWSLFDLIFIMRLRIIFKYFPWSILLESLKSGGMLSIRSPWLLAIRFFRLLRLFRLPRILWLILIHLVSWLRLLLYRKCRLDTSLEFMEFVLILDINIWQHSILLVDFGWPRSLVDGLLVRF
jgi:hypothetical protein